MQLRFAILPILMVVTAAGLLGFEVSTAAKPRTLMWDDLIPAVEKSPPPTLPGADPFKDRKSPVPMYEGVGVVKALDGQLVRIPGYVVPLESDEGGLLDEFLLVPFVGACIHVPPPPPNQLVYVRLAKPFEMKSMWQPYWITGTLSTRPWSGEIADAYYQLQGTRVEKYAD